ncbi:MAG: guanylate kinase [Dehalococcoidia bacterium]|nr:guanylate kinase [Dehalococcoidia bacterium]
MRKPVVLVLHGPSGVGKDTIINELQQRIGIKRATSTNSRLPRQGERDGIDYHFVTPDEFLDRVERREFAERALVYGDLKGLEKREIEGPLAHGQDVIVRTDVQGARHWRRVLPGAITVLIKAEDVETLRDRLHARATDGDEELARRYAEIEEELADEPNNDYVVVNRHGGQEAAIAELISIIERERENPARPLPKLAI